MVCQEETEKTKGATKGTPCGVEAQNMPPRVILSKLAKQAPSKPEGRELCERIYAAHFVRANPSKNAKRYIPSARYDCIQLVGTGVLDCPKINEINGNKMARIKKTIPILL